MAKSQLVTVDNINQVWSATKLLNEVESTRATNSESSLSDRIDGINSLIEGNPALAGSIKNMIWDILTHINIYITNSDGSVITGPVHIDKNLNNTGDPGALTIKLPSTIQGSTVKGAVFN